MENNEGFQELLREEFQQNLENKTDYDKFKYFLDSNWKKILYDKLEKYERLSELDESDSFEEYLIDFLAIEQLTNYLFLLSGVIHQGKRSTYINLIDEVYFSKLLKDTTIKFKKFIGKRGLFNLMKSKGFTVDNELCVRPVFNANRSIETDNYIRFTNNEYKLEIYLSVGTENNFFIDDVPYSIKEIESKIDNALYESIFNKEAFKKIK